MPKFRIALIIAALMFAASAGALLARPTVKVADVKAHQSLESTVPGAFGDWRLEPQRIAQVVNPQTQELLDKLYSEVLSRTYVNGAGYRVMISIAYGTDQREGSTLKAHKPEVCYPAQGFTLHSNVAGTLRAGGGEIPVSRLSTSLGDRREPVTYWFTIGDQAVKGKLEKRLVELRYGLTGQIPDGLLFRVSSIDPDTGRAFRMHEQFVNQLLDALPPSDRARISGLASTP
jgi:EpsI family protein